MSAHAARGARGRAPEPAGCNPAAPRSEESCGAEKSGAAIRCGAGRQESDRHGAVEQMRCVPVRPHRNIAVFIPHMGCPHRCVFCDQHSISGSGGFDESRVPEQIETALQTIPTGTDVEIAYFGGSFTGIDRGLMLRLLELAAGYVRAGRVSGIRLSTRPDLIDSEVLGILRQYPVRAVELGLQSMDDRVLEASRRGHTAAQGEDACRAVTGAGFALVGQMMIGLPCSTPESERRTAERICRLGACAARIYPTVVFRGTPLAGMMRSGVYRPLTTGEAVWRSADVLEILKAHGVACLRIGLCASESLTSPEEALAGANHPALGELVWGELYYRRLRAMLGEDELLGQKIELILPAREISKWVGQRRRNLDRLRLESGTEVRRVAGDWNASEPRAIPWKAY